MLFLPAPAASLAYHITTHKQHRMVNLPAPLLLLTCAVSPALAFLRPPPSTLLRPTTTRMMASGGGSSSPPSSIFIVTGSTDGIGQHTASNLALSPGFKVFVHGRSSQKVKGTVEALGVPQFPGSGDVEGFVADLSSFKDIRRLAQEMNDRIEKLGAPDAPVILINNAGVFSQTRRESADGLEMTFAVNVAAPFLLTGLLLPTLKKRKRSRVVNVSSISQGGRVPWDDLQLALPGAFSDHRSYSLSKLLMAMFSMELAAKHGSADLPVVCCDPGTVNTKMLEAGWGLYGIDVSVANDETFLATDPKVGGANGKYFVSRRDTQANPEAYNVEDRQRLWGMLEEMCGISY